VEKLGVWRKHTPSYVEKLELLSSSFSR
jgi:hypothetical protein